MEFSSNSNGDGDDNKIAPDQSPDQQQHATPSLLDTTNKTTSITAASDEDDDGTDADDNTPLSEIKKFLFIDNTPLSEIKKSLSLDNTPLSEIKKSLSLDNTPLSEIKKLLSQTPLTGEEDEIPSLETNNYSQEKKGKINMKLKLPMRRRPLIEKPHYSTRPDVFVDEETYKFHACSSSPVPSTILSRQDFEAVSTTEGEFGYLCRINISPGMLDDFMSAAKENTEIGLETGAVICGFMRDDEYYVTALLIPKQIGRTDEYEAFKEEELHHYQYINDLIPLGTIHTHPSHLCFMSSIDLHNHFGYQKLISEAIAIVMAPNDPVRKCGIFRLTDAGMKTIRNCDRRGFHTHPDPPGHAPIYHKCANYIMDRSIDYVVLDFRAD